MKINETFELSEKTDLIVRAWHAPWNTPIAPEMALYHGTKNINKKLFNVIYYWTPAASPKTRAHQLMDAKWKVFSIWFWDVSMNVPFVWYRWNGDNNEFLNEKWIDVYDWISLWFIHNKLAMKYRQEYWITPVSFNHMLKNNKEELSNILNWVVDNNSNLVWDMFNRIEFWNWKREPISFSKENTLKVKWKKYDWIDAIESFLTHQISQVPLIDWDISVHELDEKKFWLLPSYWFLQFVVTIASLLENKKNLKENVSVIDCWGWDQVTYMTGEGKNLLLSLFASTGITGEIEFYNATSNKSLLIPSWMENDPMQLYNFLYESKRLEYFLNSFGNTWRDYNTIVTWIEKDISNPLKQKEFIDVYNSVLNIHEKKVGKKIDRKEKITVEKESIDILGIKENDLWQYPRPTVVIFQRIVNLFKKIESWELSKHEIEQSKRIIDKIGYSILHNLLSVKKLTSQQIEKMEWTWDLKIFVWNLLNEFIQRYDINVSEKDRKSILSYIYSSWQRSLN